MTVPSRRSLSRTQRGPCGCAHPQIESEERWAAIAGTEVCQRWWKAMAPLMVVDGIRPVSRELREVFHLP